MKFKKMLYLIPLFILALFLFAEEMIWHYHNTGKVNILVDSRTPGTIVEHYVDGEDFLWRSWVALSLDSLNENLIYAENNEDGIISGGNIDTIFTEFNKIVEYDSTFNTEYYVYYIEFYYDSLNDETLSFHEDSVPSLVEIDSLGLEYLDGHNVAITTDSVLSIDTLVFNSNLSEFGYGNSSYDVEIFQRIYTEYIPEESEETPMPYIPIEFSVINNSTETLRNAKFIYFYDSDIPIPYDEASFDLAEFTEDYRTAYIYYDGDRAVENSMGFTVLSDCEYVLGSYKDWYANGDSINDLEELFTRPAQPTGSGSEYYTFDTLITVHDSTLRVFEDYIYDSTEYTVMIYDSLFEDTVFVSIDTSESSYVLVDTFYIDNFESEMRIVEYYEYVPIFDSDSSITGFEEVLITDTIPAVTWADTFSNPIVYIATDAETTFVSRFSSERVHSDYAVYVKFFIPDLAPGEEYNMEIALVGGDDIEQLLEYASQALDTTTAVDTSDTVYFIQDIDEIKPETYSLSAYPNPFNSTLNIENPFGGRIEVLNIQGKVIDTIEENQTTWKADNISSGIYLIRPLKKPSEIKRVVYLK